MKATLTELRRDTGRVLGSVIHGKQTVELTQHGATVAQISPKARGMSPQEFARIWRDRKPLGVEAADEVAQALREIDQAK